MGIGEDIFAFVLGASLLLTRCRQIVGIEPRQVSDAGAPTAVFPACVQQIRGMACAACTKTSCCAAAQQCVGLCLDTEKCVQRHRALADCQRGHGHRSR